LLGSRNNNFNKQILKNILIFFCITEEKKSRESAMNPFGVPSRKVKEIKIEDFIV